MAFANRFGWSLSREATFDDCRRRYYFHYYLSWGGWQAGSPAIAREAFKLKRLVSLPLWRGQLVHYVASVVLRSMKAKGKIPDREKVIGYTLERFNAQYEFSREKKYLTVPKKRGDRLNIDWLALFEHEYSRVPRPAQIDEIRNECVRGVEALCESPLLVALLETDRGKWDIEDIAGGDFSQQFIHGGAIVYVKTDFMFRALDGSLCIVDWKTNRETAAGDEAPNAAVQLGIYAYYAARVLHESVASIRLLEVNLLCGGKMIEHIADEESIASAEERISSGVARLADVLVERDTARNEALAAEHFPRAENAHCRYCNFYRLCKDETYPDRLV
ncbi:MAG: PD-(D/E)XK nuclease family protein [Candidatus Krumholzibacteria bacterium]|nr:PD-(D/E)XK nuclease family protein [Candidatus Krumholzibacteria bacterium]